MLILLRHVVEEGKEVITKKFVKIPRKHVVIAVWGGGGLWGDYL